MKICQAIKVLSQRVPTPQTAFVSHLTPTQQAKVVNLVGRKCTVKCLLNDSEVAALWDTGAQVSIMTKGMLGHVGTSRDSSQRHIRIDQCRT